MDFSTLLLHDGNYSLPDVDTDNTIVIIATGGTIAGVGQSGKETGYHSGELSVESVINSVPEIETVANIVAIQLCNLNSDDISSDIWIRLAKLINSLAGNPKVRGFVITHGTDTVEETSYFLNLTIKTRKPVVFTGSMRPATSISADGPMNLYHAVCLASSDDAIGHGVLIVFSDRIIAARHITKSSTYSINAISSDEMGCLGIIRDNNIYFYNKSIRRHTIDSEFDISFLESLPEVSTIYFSTDADPKILKYASKHSDGIVIAGAGAGEFSKEFMQIIDGLDIPVVVSSRTTSGIISQNSVLCRNTIAADNLSPQKASILLRLSLANNYKREDLIRVYSQY